MRLLIISQWFDPEPTFKGLRFAQTLQAMGHDVEVLTGYPNYPEGKLYSGFTMKGYRREMMEGVRVLRVPLYPSHDRSRFRRTLNYLSFGVAATLAIFSVRRPDAVYVCHPPATTALPAIAMRMLRGAPFVYDVLDLWPDTLSATGMVADSTVLRLVEYGMRFIYRRASYVATSSNGMRVAIVARGVPAAKVSVIPNWTYESEPVQPLESLTNVPHRSDDEFRVVYAGNVGAAQALKTVLDTAVLLVEKAPSVRFVIFGDGVELSDLKAEAKRLSLPNLNFEARVPPSHVDRALAEADALLVHLKDHPLFRITTPGKTQAYLHAGRPILMGVRGDAADLIQRAKAGIVFSPEDPPAMAAAILTMIAMSTDEREALGASGARYYREHLSLAAGVRGFVALLESAHIACRPGLGLKRLIDVVVSALLLIVGCIPLLGLAAFVAREHGRPVLFRQTRPGRDGKPFDILKFRTMTNARSSDGELLPDSKRLAPFGAWLRTTSLDELPELLNVLRGDMSLVGPRPLLTRYTPFFTEEEALRLRLRPGITGWAQVNGRNATSWDSRLALDVWYARRWTLGLDFKILLMTARRLWTRDGAFADPASLMLDLDAERSGRSG